MHAVSAPEYDCRGLPIRSPPMRIGYGRVSTRDQNPDAQRDALAAAGCDEVFVDKASGKLARRPELEKALLSANRAGDQLVVTKLDRLGRSLEHLIGLAKDLQGRGVDLEVLDQGIDTSTAVGRMFFQILGAIAEFEHTLMSERTTDGLAAARARGRTGGQKPKLTPARPASPSRCTTRRAQTASAATPWRRSPPNSASPGLPSTGTSDAGSSRRDVPRMCPGAAGWFDARCQSVVWRTKTVMISSPARSLMIIYIDSTDAYHEGGHAAIFWQYGISLDPREHRP
jgi:DNA invertase Pin-like site-specific DNA recombinase